MTPHKPPFQFGLVASCGLIATLAIATMSGCSSQEPIDKQTEAVFMALERPMDLEVEELPLTDTMEYIGSSQGIDIQFEAKAIEDTNAPVTAIAYSGKGKPVRQVIAEILKPYGLTYTVADGVLMIVKPKPGQ